MRVKKVKVSVLIMNIVISLRVRLHKEKTDGSRNENRIGVPGGKKENKVPISESGLGGAVVRESQTPRADSRLIFFVFFLIFSIRRGCCLAMSL